MSARKISQIVLDAFVAGFGQAVGERLGEHVCTVLGRRWARHTADVRVPELSRLALRDYLKGSIFIEYQRKRIIEWGMWQLAHAAPAEQAAAMMLARQRGDGSMAGMLHGVVTYFATKEVGH